MNNNLKWTDISGQYKKTNHYEPESAVTPYGSREAVLAFSREYSIRKYTSPETFNSIDGMPRYGEYITLPFWCIPYIDRIDSKNSESGEYNDGLMKIIYLPDHPKHEEPIYLQTSENDNSDYNGFDDIIECNGNLWSINNHWMMDVGVKDHDQYICRASLILHVEKEYLKPEPVESFGHYHE